MTSKSLHDHHTARLAWRVRRLLSTSDPATSSSVQTAREAGRTARRRPNLETWMKLVKTSAIAVAISALLAGPVLAQGASSDTQTRGGVRGTTQMQGGASGSADEDAPAAGQRAGAKTGMKGTVGAGSGAPHGTAKTTGGAATPPASGR
jgi:hypothetical protein